MQCIVSPPQVAIVGAGIAGATCARALSTAGFVVQVVDKSRGAGGRLATRRLDWLDPQGRPRRVRVDHGAPGFAAQGADFQRFLATLALADGLAGTLVAWTPTLAAGSRPLDDALPLWLPQPDMPSLCRSLLQGVATTWSFAVDRLQRGPLGWQLEAGGALLPGHFDAVVLALPPAQAAPLLAPHRNDWAQRASLALMQPRWTLMGVARRPARAPDWDTARPQQGPLAWIMRNEARPGRTAEPDEVHWVAHARAGWSRQHLEHPAEGVRAQLQSALQAWLGEPVEWRHAVAHRWRYATPQPAGAALAQPCWWDEARGLGVCGDFLGGLGVEGAWRSAQSVSEVLLRGLATRSTPGRPDHPTGVGPIDATDRTDLIAPIDPTDHPLQRAAA